jgi:hypothetical protein
MIINLLWDASVTGSNGPPPAFQQDVQIVASYLSGHFTDDITINLHVGFGEVNGTTLSANSLGQSQWNVHKYSYTDYKSALAQKTDDDATAIASLPSSDPLPGTHDFWVADPLAAALGLLKIDVGSPPIEGWVGFSNTLPFDYNRADGITAGQYDFIGTVAHEITEVMGRFLGVGEDVINNDGRADFFPLDLFHYASGSRSFTRGGSFSIDGGQTTLAEFSTSSTGDAGDWGGSTTNDSFLAFSNSGVYNDITPVDLRLMDILGYHGYPDDYGDDINFAWHLTVGTPQNGNIELPADFDWFRVKLDAGIRYSIQVKGADSNNGTLADPYVNIWDSTSHLLAGDNDTGLGRDAYLSFTPSTSGYYYITASSFISGAIGSYTVKVNVAPKQFIGDHLPIDLVSAKAVDSLPTFLGGNHNVEIPSEQAFAAQPNLTTGWGLSGSDPVLSAIHDGPATFSGSGVGALHAHDWIVA